MSDKIWEKFENFLNYIFNICGQAIINSLIWTFSGNVSLKVTKTSNFHNFINIRLFVVNNNNKISWIRTLISRSPDGFRWAAYTPCCMQGINSCRVYPCTTLRSRETIIVNNMPCRRPYAPSGIRTHNSLIMSREHEPLQHSATISTDFHKIFTRQVYWGASRFKFVAYLYMPEGKRNLWKIFTWI